VIHKIQKFDLRARLAPSRPVKGRIWRTLGRARRVATAEAIARFARMDDASALVRIAR